MNASIVVDMQMDERKMELLIKKVMCLRLFRSVMQDFGQAIPILACCARCRTWGCVIVFS